MNRNANSLWTIKWLLLGLGLLSACTAGQVALRPVDQMFRQGEQAYENGQYAEAVRTYQAFMETASGDPRVAHASLRTGQSLFALGDDSKARQVLNHLLSGFPESDEADEAALFLSRIEHRQGNTEASLALLRDVVRQARNRDVVAMGYLLRGSIFLERGDVDLALAQWKKSLLVAGEPEKSRALYKEMAKFLEKSVSMGVLETMTRETPQTFPGDVSLFVMGKRAHDAGDMIKASQIFEKLNLLFPGHPLLQEINHYEEQGHAISALKKVRIGCILPLSGPFKEIGNQVLQGTLLAVDKLNSLFLEERVEVVIQDSGGEPFKARDAMIELARDPTVLAVIGPVTSRSVVESAMVAEDARLPMITPTATAEGIGQMGRYVFRNAMTNGAQARTIARYAVKELRLNSFVIFYPNDFYGLELNDLFREEVTALGGEMIASVPYKRGSVDYGPEIRNFVRKDIQGIIVRNKDILQMEKSMDEWLDNYYPSFDAVYLPGYAEDVGLIVPQLAFYNIESVQLLGSHNWNSVELVRRGERFVEGAIFTDGFFNSSPHTDIQEFAAGYRRAYGEEPTLFSAQAYDAADMVLQVFYRGGSSREEVQKSLSSLQNFPGVSGLTHTLPSGEMAKELFLIQVKDGIFRQIN